MDRPRSRTLPLSILTAECLLWGQKPTFVKAMRTSALCHKRTSRGHGDGRA